MNKSMIDKDINDSNDIDEIDTEKLERQLMKKFNTIENSVHDAMTNNIFCPNIENLNTRFNGEINTNILYKTFGNPFIVCIKDTSNFESYFYNKIISEHQMNELINSIVIIPITYKIINCSTLKYLSCVSSHIFNSLDVFDKYGIKITSSSDVLLCSLLRFKHTNVIKYLKQFEGVSNFIDLYNALLMNEYLGQPNKTSTIRQNRIQMICNMSESNYYTIYNNCQLNITQKFKARRFNLALSQRLADQTVQTVLKHLSESKEDENNYLAFLFKKSNYLDASSAIINNGYKLYRITNNPLMEMLSNEHFNSLYDKLTYQEKYYLIMNGMISKDLCHLIINNKYILNEILNVKDPKGYTLMNKYGQLIRYLFGYAWLTMYMEESIKRGYVTNKDRFIFDIETASMLPYFPYSPKNLHICPYIPILVENNTICAEKNILGVEQYIFNSKDPEYIKNTRYGVCDKETFIKRFNMFVSGDDNNNIMKDINWNNLAVSGSIMACCLPNLNSLMCNFIKSKQNFTVDFVSYVKQYYKESDIDVMCNLQNIYEFIDKIYEFSNKITQNIKDIKNIKSDVDICNIISNKTVAIMINKSFINNYICKETGLDFIKILSDINAPVIKSVVYNYYIKWHKEYLIKSAKENINNFINPKYHDIFIPVTMENINIVFVKSQKDINEEKNENKIDENKIDENKVEQIGNIKLEEEDKEFEQERKISSENEQEDNTKEYDVPNNIIFIPKINFKFRLSSPYLSHCFEFFQTKFPEFFSTVSRFHLPIVRSYYDGNNIYITPSCISACMTLLNFDYKYFAGSRDPIEIINKYRMRGFGTILNDHEIIRLIEYSDLIPKWKQAYDLNIKSNTSIVKILGHLNINDHLFNTPQITEFEHLYHHDHVKLPDDLNSLIDVIRKLYNTTDINGLFNMSKIMTINNFGYVEPVKKWLINAFFDSMFNNVETINKYNIIMEEVD